MNVIFSEKAYSAILCETLEKIKTETGGLFLGFFENETFYIVETVDPGPNSIFEVAYFEYDQKYVSHLINKIAKIYKKRLFLIGLWHRHPGSFDIFSGTDDGTNKKFASMNKFGAISCLVNIDPTFRLTVYHVSNPLKYTKIAYQVSDGLFPNGSLSLLTKEELLEKINNGTNEKKYSKLLEFFKVHDDLIKKNIFSTKNIDDSFINCDLADCIIDDIEFFINDLSINIAIRRENDNKIIIGDNGFNVFFFKNDKYIIFNYLGNNYNYKPSLFKSLMNNNDNVENIDKNEDLPCNKDDHTIEVEKDKIVERKCGFFEKIKMSFKKKGD